MIKVNLPIKIFLVVVAALNVAKIACDFMSVSLIVCKLGVLGTIFLLSSMVFFQVKCSISPSIDFIIITLFSLISVIICALFFTIYKRIHIIFLLFLVINCYIVSTHLNQSLCFISEASKLYDNSSPMETKMEKDFEQLKWEK